MNSATVSPVSWDMWWKSWAANALPSKFNFSLIALTADSYNCLLVGSRRSHFLCALPCKWPASCSSFSSSSHPYQVPALSSVGSQLSHSWSALFPVNGSMGGAFPLLIWLLEPHSAKCISSVIDVPALLLTLFLQLPSKASSQALGMCWYYESLYSKTILLPNKVIPKLHTTYSWNFFFVNHSYKVLLKPCKCVYYESHAHIMGHYVYNIII